MNLLSLCSPKGKYSWSIVIFSELCLCRLAGFERNIAHRLEAKFVHPRVTSALDNVKDPQLVKDLHNKFALARKGVYTFS